jgi:hypothetical protein
VISRNANAIAGGLLAAGFVFPGRSLILCSMQEESDSAERIFFHRVDKTRISLRRTKASGGADALMYC